MRWDSGDTNTFSSAMGQAPDFVIKFFNIYEFVSPPVQRQRGCPHAFLGVSCGSSEEEITKAYRQAAMKVHPDRGPSEEAEARGKKMRFLNSAYEAALEDLP